MSRILMKRCRGAAVLLAVGLGGCSTDSSPKDTLPRVAVSGTVTLGGKPLPHGVIQFNSEGGDAAVNAVGKVEEGKFSIEQAQGPVPGKYRVTISSRQPLEIKPDEQPGSTPKPEPEKVPAQYNSKSTLTKEITANGPNELDFDLTSG